VTILSEWAKNRNIEYSLIYYNNNDKTFNTEPRYVYRKKHVSIICTDKNLGYGGGNNVGIKYLLGSEVDYILILNNDMKLFPSTLNKMWFALKENRHAGAIGCDIFDMNTGKQLPTGKMNYWLGVHFLIRFSKKAKGVQETNFIPGCALLVKKDVFIDVGGFNEQYFLYADDIEFCHKVKEYGWKLIMNLDAKILAKVSDSSGGHRNPLYYYFVVRNTLYFISHELKSIQRTVAAIAFLGARVAQIIQWAILRKPELIIAAINGLIDFSKGISGIGSAKKYLDELEAKTKIYNDIT
jgi:GT2 family glycosyltransferase